MSRPFDLEDFVDGMPRFHAIHPGEVRRHDGSLCDPQLQFLRGELPDLFSSTCDMNQHVGNPISKGTPREDLLFSCASEAQNLKPCGSGLRGLRCPGVKQISYDFAPALIFAASMMAVSCAGFL